MYQTPVTAEPTRPARLRLAKVIAALQANV